MKQRLLIGLAALALALVTHSTQAGQCNDNLMLFINQDVTCPVGVAHIDLPAGYSFTTNGLGQLIIPYINNGYANTNSACTGTNGGFVEITLENKSSCCDVPERIGAYLTWHHIEGDIWYAIPLFFPHWALSSKYEIYFTGSHCESESYLVRRCAIQPCDGIEPPPCD